MAASGGPSRWPTLLSVVALVLAGRAEPSSAIDRDRAAEHLAAAIRFRTVSHQDPSEDDRTQFAGLRTFLARTYPKVHRSLVRELVNGDGLLYTWKGADASAKPVLLMAHQDVVPVEPGTEGRWVHPPFGGAIADGFVWGRGALDDKASLVFLMEAVESLLADGFRPPRTVYLASGFDEEVGGLEGAARIAALLAERGVRLDYVLDEGRFVSQGVVPGVQEPVASIGIAEKGYVSVELVAETEGGHSSRPPPETAIGLLAAAIDRLERHPMPARLRGAPRREMQALAPYMTSEPSPESSTDSPAYHVLEQTIRALFPNAVPAPSLVLGGTDSRHFAAVADDVYRFMPFRVGPEDLTRFHGTDERFEIEQIESAVEFYRRILRAPL